MKSNGKVDHRIQGFMDPILANKQAEAVNNATSLSRQMLFGMGDDRRDIEAECGYPPLGEAISVELYKRLYDRSEVANRAVQLMPKECMQSEPKVFEDDDPENETEFETKFRELGDKLLPGSNWHDGEEGNPFWAKVQQADTLSRIGGFGIILLGIADGKNLQEPIDGQVTLNTKAVPIFEERIVRNAQGILRKERRQVGTKSVIVNKRAVMPDCVAPKFELDAVENMRPRKFWIGCVNKEHKYEEQKPIPLNEDEKQVVANWRKEKQTTERVARVVKGMLRAGRVNQAAMVVNAAVARGACKAQNLGLTPKERALIGNGLLVNADLKAGARPPVSKGGPIEPNNSFPSEAKGTDRQYGTSEQSGASGFGMKPPQYGAGSMSGTDQQYFGVQLGPTEMPSGEVSEEHELTFMRCYDESLVQIVRYEWNVNNPRFGMPVMYRVMLNDPRENHGGIGLPMATVFVHWSRVIHLNDRHANAGSSEIFSPPIQRPILNRLLDCYKLPSAAAEGYWRSGTPVKVFNTHPQLGGDVLVNESDIRDSVENLDNSQTKSLIGRGGAWSLLAPSMVDPSPFWNTLIEAICICLGVPVRVFKGSERGELASSQDDASWNDRLRDRQNRYLTPWVICPLINRLIEIGVLPEPEQYSIEWPDLDSLTDKDKAQIALTLTQADSAYVSGGVENLIPQEYYLKEVRGLPHSQVEEITKQNEQKEQEDAAAAQDLADEHGFEPTPPEGFHDPQQQQMEHEQKLEQIKAGQGFPAGPPTGQPKPGQPPQPAAPTPKMNPGNKAELQSQKKTEAEGGQ